MQFFTQNVKSEIKAMNVRCNKPRQAHREVKDLMQVNVRTLCKLVYVLYVS